MNASSESIHCDREELLEIAALRLFSMGIDLRSVPPREYARLANGLEGPLAATIRHAAECCRCRELIAIFQATEAALPEELARSKPAAAHPGEARLMELRPVTLDHLSDSPGEGPAGEHALAAASGKEDGDTILPAERPVISLMSTDGRYIVRIFPRGTGPGATAVLMRGQTPPDASASTAEQPRISIILDGTEYEFDDRDVARLPRFPADPLSILVR